MERQKRWQFLLILAVVVLTLFNILPTVFYYSKPLRSPIDESRAMDVGKAVIDRVEDLKPFAEDWLHSFTNLIKVKPKSISQRQGTPQFIDVTFEKEYEAQRFKRFLPRAGSLIPFVPAQLKLAKDLDKDPKTVAVERQIAVELKDSELNQLFQFAEKFQNDGYPTPLYRSIVFDRIDNIALALGGSSEQGLQVERFLTTEEAQEKQQLGMALSKDIVDAKTVLSNKSEQSILKRYYASFSQYDGEGKETLASTLVTKFKELKSSLSEKRKSIIDSKEAIGNDSSEREKLSLVENQIKTLDKAIAVVETHKSDFNAAKTPVSREKVKQLLSKSYKNYDPSLKTQVLDLVGSNPFVKDLRINWGAGGINVEFFDDIQAIRSKEPKTESQAFVKSRLGQMLVNAIAEATNRSGESIVPRGEGFGVALSNLSDSQSFLAFDLGVVAEKQQANIERQLTHAWKREHPDLSKESYPVHSWNAFQKLSTRDKQLGLVVYAPSLDKAAPPQGFDKDSIYVIARGLKDVLRKYQELPNAPGRDTLLGDFETLRELLTQDGFIAYPGSSLGIDEVFKNDIIFRLPNYYGTLLDATREEFVVKGNKRYATLDFTDVEQRILTTNRIEDSIQEDLLKWRDEYQASQVDLDPSNRLTVPAPTVNPFWSNIKLSARKYFRGDDKKILKWGLDLSGGKTVRIALRDQNNRPVTQKEDLNQAVNELYTRINKMGVAERTIRIEGDSIILDFPGSQGLSAADLVKASSMTFNIVNMKFSQSNQELAASTNAFLQGVWNEAVVTNRNDAESINEIAWKHLGGVTDTGEQTYPRSEHANTLHENGLVIPPPEQREVSSSFNDTASRIAVLRGEDFTQWHGQTHPLIIVFNNFALEGSSLENIQASYDPGKGNILNFQVKNSYEKGTGSPRDDFFAWTSEFAKEKIEGTLKEKYSLGRGWPMAVILNDSIISMPSLEAPLRDGGMISGKFSQREVNQLVSDLKAGSLTYTPKIISEHNVSPELGKEERARGIMAAIVGLAFVVVIMVGYYRFAGVVACCALLFNLLIMWGVLQNLGAALTLPGIAGIVLTIGMAVDANVLVFERIREEFAVSNRIVTAIQAGYQKAFTAIIDSNLTTILAALILIQFDAGPVKGFAVVLIVGVISSMFTALFVTRYYFAGWVQNPAHKELKMHHWIGDTKFDFLAQTKKAFILTGVVLFVSGYLLSTQQNTILGMDFTGGYSLHATLQEKSDTESYRNETIQALVNAGANPRDVQVQQLSRDNQLRIQLGVGMEEPGQPFYNLPETQGNGFEYSYMANPRIQWVVESLESSGLKILPSQLKNLESNWTVMSGQFSNTMRNNALMALSLALLAILLYITFRFEFKYAIAAVAGLTHDVLITLGIVAFFHWLGFNVQINLETIGAIMTIIGYSLNDTIIVFDRIREDIRLLRKLAFKDIINHALNVTLSRTLLTSGTTLSVLVALVLLGGQTIFGFSLVMLIGVLIGTLSSLFIAPPIMLYFHDREVAAEEKNLQYRHATK